MKRFVVTEDHLKLLNRINIGYNDYTEFGAPEVDPKRPYGNSSVYADIAEILGWMDESWWDGDQEIPREWKESGMRIHKEMETVLQILVLHARVGIQAGDVYETSSSYSNDWTKV